MGIFNQIPEPTTDPAALVETIKALKATVDILTSALNQPGSPNQTFVQRTTPTANKIGDNWIKPAVLIGETVVFSSWDGKRWLRII